MFSKTFLLAVAFLAVFASAEEDAVNVFKDDVAKAAEKAREFGEHIAKMLGFENIPSSTEVVEIIKTQAKNFADHAEKVQRDIDNELKRMTNTTLAESFSEFNKKVVETVSTFRQQIENSQVAEQATALQGKFQSGITALLDESKKLASELEPQMKGAGVELESLAKKVLDVAVNNLGQLQDKLHTATGHEAQVGPNPKNP